MLDDARQEKRTLAEPLIGLLFPIDDSSVECAEQFHQQHFLGRHNNRYGPVFNSLVRVIHHGIDVITSHIDLDVVTILVRNHCKTKNCIMRRDAVCQAVHRTQLYEPLLNA